MAARAAAADRVRGGGEPHPCEPVAPRSRSPDPRAGAGALRHRYAQALSLAYAIYAARSLAVKRTAMPALVDLPWIGFDDDHSYMPGQRWIHEQIGRRPEIRVNNWLVLHDAVRSGAGLAVLPCYLADQDPRLRRVGGVLPEITTEQWLLVHRDLRALPRVRAVMDALVELFQRHRSNLEGRGGTTVP